MAAITQQQLEAPRYYPFNALRMDFPGYTARLWTGNGPLSMLSQTFEGAGRVLEIGAAQSSLETISPVLRAKLSGLPQQDSEGNDIIAELVNYPVKGARCWVWFGLLDAETGLLAADPDLVHFGMLDAPAFTIDDTAIVTVDILSAMEFAMRKAEGRWNPAHHEALYPADTFFEFVGRRPQPFAATTPPPNTQT